MDSLLRTLLIEDDYEDAALIARCLEDVRSPRILLEHATSLQVGCQRLSAESFDAVLLDLQLPDACGLEVVDRLSTAWPEGAIVVLTGSEDDALGADAVRHGAEDYLTKNTISGPLVARALGYAVERRRFNAPRKISEASVARAVNLYSTSLSDSYVRLLNAVARLSDLLLPLQPDAAPLVDEAIEAATSISSLLRQGIQGRTGVEWDACKLERNSDADESYLTPASE